MTTAFGPAAEWAGRARAALARSSPYLAHVDFQAGSVAMARGRTGEAAACYERALKRARASFLRDAGAVMIGEALVAELALERTAGAVRAGGPRASPRLLGECTAWFDIYAASIGVGAEIELQRAGPAAALALVEDAREYARHTARPALTRFTSALRVSMLLAAGDVGQAARAWRFDGLPEESGACVDLDRQSWREMEMLACVRLQLLAARGALDPARELAAALQAAAGRDLVRTRMRGLALSMALEHRAGEAPRATAHLAEYLRLFARSDYVRPLARDAALALALLDGIAEPPPGAAALRAALREEDGMGEDRWAGPLNRPEMEVLVLLEERSDADIARTLSLSYEGVRSRIRRIFAKLGARSRHDAVHRARKLGMLPPA